MGGRPYSARGSVEEARRQEGQIQQESRQIEAREAKRRRGRPLAAAVFDPAKLEIQAAWKQPRSNG